MKDKEYKQILHSLIEEVSKIEHRRKRVRDLNIRKAGIYDKIHAFILSSLSTDNMEYSPEVEKYYYSINFRIPATVPESQKHRYKDGCRVGFFFTGGSFPGWRVRDYEYLYDASGPTGRSGLFLILDYAEEIIEKCRVRMKQKKYSNKYNLDRLIDALHSLSVLRGNKYFVREGTPPEKYVPGKSIDPVTGKEKKQRGSSTVLNIPFKIVSVKIDDGGV